MHPLTYGNHPNIWGFLVNYHGIKMNWAKYIHNCTQGVDAWYIVNNLGKTRITYSIKSNNM